MASRQAGFSGGAKERSSGWKFTIASRSRPTVFRMSPTYALGMIWDVGIWNVPTDPIKNHIDQSLASLLHHQLCFARAVARSRLHALTGSEQFDKSTKRDRKEPS